MKFRAPEESCVKPTAHRQDRAIVTREQLIQAARVVFTERGFESARIEEIAAKARKTRGAFYDNFRDKEDIFFAIFEQDISRDHETMIDAMSGAASLDERVAILARHLEELFRDKERVLLNLEFKLYVIRHPQKRKRLGEIYSEVRLRCSMTKINSLFPELANASVEKRQRLTAEIGAIIDGLALNSLFDREGLCDKRRKRILQVAAREALQDARDL